MCHHVVFRQHNTSNNSYSIRSYMHTLANQEHTVAVIKIIFVLFLIIREFRSTLSQEIKTWAALI